MKKKQKQKLFQQFQPSLDTIRGKLFKSIEQESLLRYNLPLQIMIDTQDKKTLIIGLTGNSADAFRVHVPIDDNFHTVIKRIRNGEKELFIRFRDNLLVEIVSYWNDYRMDQQQTSKTKKVESVNTTQLKEQVDQDLVEQTSQQAETTEDASAYSTFETAIRTFPKLFVEKNADFVVVKEKSTKEDRLLAQISMTKTNTFELTPALTRKYKIKLEIIPLIETFAATSLNERD